MSIQLTIRATTLATAVIILCAFTEDDIEKARQAAHFYKEKYWECLAAEIVRNVPTNISAQDFSLLVKSACPQEKNNFRVPLVDYIAMKDGASGSDIPGVFSAADIAITAAQDDAVKGFINLRNR
jgi:hypothetical protein